MGIRKLPQEIYMKIAAGEVVTSAASVVKELVENSIDASADTIKVEIKNGGRDSIIVSDNGKGIPADELSLAVEPHATSKIDKWDDILNLSTYGFRGEALASVAAVSELYISSKTETDDVGRRIYFRDGVPAEEKAAVRNVGTEIEIRNLFFNVPARRKFLKSPSTESRYVLDTVEKFILSNPAVAFQFVRDGKIIYDIKVEPFKKRINRILKIKEPENIVDVAFSDGSFSVHGAVSSPQINRPNMTGITLFVNSRYVKDSVVYAAIKEFFSPLLNKGRYPLAVLFITVPSDEVDINVHPQKLEIKYSDGGSVYRLIKKALNNAFNDFSLSMNVREDDVKQSSEKKEGYEQDTMAQKKPIDDTFVRDTAVFERETMYKPSIYDKPKPINTSEVIGILKREPIQVENSVFERGFSEKRSEKHEMFSEKRILGIVDRRYIVVEEKNELSLIDFHAAHERILFEKIKSRERNIFVQKILDTLHVEVDSAAVEILRDKKGQFEELGFDYNIIGNTEIDIVGIPNLIKKDDAIAVFKEMIDELRLLELEKESKVMDNVYATIACHNAFRTGDFVNTAEATELIRQMDEYEVFSCPHGRPVRFSISFSKLDSFFKRS